MKNVEMCIRLRVQQNKWDKNWKLKNNLDIDGQFVRRYFLKFF